MMINNNSFTEKMERCQQYIDALEEERTKIQVFSRELPLCLELVTQAIETYKQQLSGTTTEYNLNAQSTECSEDEHTSSDVPVLEEFIPLKRTFSHEDQDEDEENESHKSKSFINNNNNNTSNSTSSKDTKNKKSDWLRSVQLWNQTSDPIPKEELTPKKVLVVEVKKNGSGGAFHPFKKEKNVVAAAEETPVINGVTPAATTSSTAENGGGTKKEDKDGQRKQRRCWSPELHRRFLHSLQQLGGSHVATPKQIRELMKVDGLTNDEVKSHLQKYRLHTRRPSPSSIHNNHLHQSPPQFMVVGGIWVPPPEYAAAIAAAAPAASGEASGVANSNGIYAPIATHPKGPLHDHASGGTLKQLRQHNKKSSRSGQHNKKSSRSERDDSYCHSDGGDVHSNSPATSSSTHTTTASPAY
ncbi:transcription factor HHO3 [Solanum dulcamara]|uniref:transcription factor HHO3 n=1 Tax=Solanum dulcamara TaxID=45834 RepID=UPI0024856F90|nr:transcription factor HHO3 [Solanum dulcamara]